MLDAGAIMNGETAYNIFFTLSGEANRIFYGIILYNV